MRSISSKAIVLASLMVVLLPQFAYAVEISSAKWGVIRKWDNTEGQSGYTLNGSIYSPRDSSALILNDLSDYLGEPGRGSKTATLLPSSVETQPGGDIVVSGLVVSAGSGIRVYNYEPVQGGTLVLQPGAGIVTYGAPPPSKSGFLTIEEAVGSSQITQTSPKAIVDWNRLNIEPGATINFDAGNSSWSVLNRIGETNNLPSGVVSPSQGGSIVISNPNGIIFTGDTVLNFGSNLSVSPSTDSVLILSSVPEPSTYMMMILGLISLGFMRNTNRT